MEHLNYCRQMTKEFNWFLLNPDDSFAINPECMKECIELAKKSKKFILPEDGVLIEDFEFKCIDSDGEINLPFNNICFEYPSTGGLISKTLVFINENDVENSIELLRVVYASHGWLPLDVYSIPRSGFMNRDVSVNRMPIINFYDSDGDAHNLDEPIGEVYVLMSFLNALQCSNVKISESNPRKTGKKIKSALPFDTYHLLTIDVNRNYSTQTSTGFEHRSPREHLRRGHIRRLRDGRRIWVNAAIIGAGKGFGVVSKGYSMRCSA